MTTNSLVHSNAFNFMSFVQGGVDPRTGQYNVSLELPALVANRLNGPHLPLRIGFNPMNPEDSGFGAGWRLNLSEYDPESQMLSLHSGERFKVFDNGPGNEPVIPERKIESFHFENISDDKATLYRVAHKSEMIEVLGLHDMAEQGKPTRQVALPVRVLTPTGHGISLTYKQVDVRSPQPGVPAKRVPCLERVEDDSKRRLLEIDYSNLNRVLITLNPGSVAQAVYTLECNNSELVKVTLPTADKGRWAFRYRLFGTVRCIEELWTPVNGREEIIYKERGHALPGGERRTLPHVERHVVNPGSNQPPLRTDYAFSSNNFLGNNTGITWGDDGEDNLYKATGADYRYDGTATHYKGDQPVYTVKSTFNRFHLMVEQVTTQNDCIETQTLVYPEIANRQFKDQPNNFQLAETTTTSWRKGLAGAPREETLTTRYDEHGNLVEKIEATGKRTLMSYYPAADDPESFVRSLETEEVVPGPGEAGAEALRNEYRYQRVSSLDNDGHARGALLRSQEQQLRVRDGVLLSQVDTLYHDAPLDSLKHGRLAEQKLTLNGKVTKTDYAYSEVSVEGHAAVQTVETLTGFDHGLPLQPREVKYAKGKVARHAQKVNTLQHSILIGEPLLNYDDNQVQIAYTYDELRRVTSETVDPKGKYKATREYQYYLSSDGQQAWQMQKDVKGVKTWSFVDGLNRAVRVTRQDPDFGPTRKAREEGRLSYSARYDALGNLVEEVEYDWLALKNLPLRTLYEYDDWRQRSSEMGPDKVRICTQTDPVGLPDCLGPVRKEWRESIQRKLFTGTTITRLNLFEQPVDVERIDNQGKRVSLHQYFYDGLGRTVREVDARGYETATAYDEFDRQVDQKLPDGSVVHRDYALHSKDDLPVLIKVLDSTDGIDHVLGTQTFDGLDRMIESVTGGRVRTMLYGVGQRQPEAVITPAENRIDYEYVPQLGEEPLSRKTLGKNADYTYDAQNARLLHCTENDETLEREYFSTGELKVERRQRSDEAQPHEMVYVHSLKGRIVSYTDVLGKTQSYEYNPFGQLQQTSLENVTSTFRYDELGRTSSILTETEDEDGTLRSLKTELFYDEFDREIRRRFDFGDAVQTLAQTYNEVDGIDSKTLTEGEEEGRKLRHETFDYDNRARLSKYTCEGANDYVPVDPYGNKIASQLFRFDGRDNITRVRTDFEGGRLNATYQFTNEKDPVQLMGIEMEWATVVKTQGGDQEAPYEKETIELHYDPDGNLELDEKKRQLTYDPLGRLVSVSVPSQGITANYGYDPLDRLASQEA